MRHYGEGTVLTVFSMALLIGACGSSSAVGPQGESVAQHEAAASVEDRQAATLCQAGNGTVCWSDRASSEAKKLREMAARHRAAAQSLLNAEASACEGIAPEDRDRSPFFHGADIRSVSPLDEALGMGARFAGATIVFRAVPGLTAEWLQRIVECHLARDAAVGYDMPEMADCPLSIPGVSATVVSAGDGFAVKVHSGDDAAAAEIWRRAQRIKARP